MNFETFFRNLIEDANIPKNEILYIHARLKNISDHFPECSYEELTKVTLNTITDVCQPKTILIPTYTYSFTKTGVYDVIKTPSEVGRLSEETRSIYSPSKKTLNPVFNHIDTAGFFENITLDETTAFGPGSLFEKLHTNGHIIVNLDVPKLIGTYLHYLEYAEKVPYRFDKIFKGTLIDMNRNSTQINYSYYVRKLEIDTQWRRDKIHDFIDKHHLANRIGIGGVNLQWIPSKSMDQAFLDKLIVDPCYLITD